MPQEVKYKGRQSSGNTYLDINLLVDLRFLYTASLRFMIHHYVDFEIPIVVIARD